MHGLTDAQIKARAKSMGAHVPEKLKLWKRHEAQADAAARASYDYDQRLLERIREKQRLITLHERDEFEGRADEEALEGERAELAEIQAERAALQAERAKPSGAVNTSSVLGWVAEQPANVKWQPSIPTPTIPRNSTARKELEKVRAEVDAIKALIREAEIAWLPEAEAVAKAVATIDKIAITGAPDFRGLFRVTKPSRASARIVQGELEWPKDYVGSEFHENGFSLTVWLHRDALVERAKKEIAALARPEKALSIADRDEKIASLKAQLLEAERWEEAWILLAIKDDPTLLRRAVDIRALLQIEEVTESETAEAEVDFG